MKNFIAVTVVFALFLALTPVIAGQKIKMPGGLTPGSGGAEDFSAFKEPDEYSLLLSGEGGAELPLLVLSKEDYIKGCLFAQIPANYNLDALKCQAAAAHTYAVRLMFDASASGGGVFNLTDDPKTCQAYFTEEQARKVYGEDYGKFLPDVEEAAKYGARTLIVYSSVSGGKDDGVPIYSVYTGVSAGKTNNASNVWGGVNSARFQYLVSVQSEWDENYRNFECTNEMTADAVRLVLLKYDRSLSVPVDAAKWFDNIRRDESGYVTSLKIGGKTFSGGDIWRMFSLRSAAFDAAFDGTNFVFTTKGYGHGAGLSQYGADYMAKKGYSCEEILKYYYKNCDIRSV